MEIPIKMDDLGLKPTIFGTIQNQLHPKHQTWVASAWSCRPQRRPFKGTKWWGRGVTYDRKKKWTYMGPLISIASWWFFQPNPFWKNMRSSKWVKIFPKFRSENKRYLSCHHLVTYVFSAIKKGPRSSIYKRSRESSPPTVQQYSRNPRCFRFPAKNRIFMAFCK